MLIVYKIKMRSWALEILSDREIKVPWDCFSESMIDQKVTKDQTSQKLEGVFVSSP